MKQQLEIIRANALEAIAQSVPPKFLELNKKAFLLGAEA